MKTIDRLSEAYENAHILNYSKDSKLVIISDAHRGVGNLSDEFTKNRNTFVYALSHYYKNGFSLIEAGDGDELWEHHQFAVIKNAHLDAFQAIQAFHDDHRFYMIYGNHNIYLKDPEYIKKHLYKYYNRYTGEVNDFLKGIVAYEAIKLVNTKTKEEVLVVHGHQGDLPNDHLWYFSMLSLKYFWRHLHAFGLQNPSSPVRNEHKRHKIERNFNKWIERTQIPLICGHTHRIKFPQKGELPYYNTGCCVYPDSITAIEIENNHICLVRWKVKTNDQGLLQIQRVIINGPSPIHPLD